MGKELSAHGENVVIASVVSMESPLSRDVLIHDRL